MNEGELVAAAIDQQTRAVAHVVQEILHLRAGLLRRQLRVGAPALFQMPGSQALESLGAGDQAANVIILAWV